jgi:hypothetical protein
MHDVVFNFRHGDCDKNVAVTTDYMAASAVTLLPFCANLQGT